MSPAKASPTYETLERELVQLQHRSTQAKETLTKIGHLNAALSAIRNINQLIVREKDPRDLIQKACDVFVETKGYWNCWIALFDESSRLMASAESGLGKAFEAKVEQLQRGEWGGVCGAALKHSELAVIQDPGSTCPHCPLSGAYAGRAGMAAPIVYGGKTYGLICASIPSTFVSDLEEQQVFKEVARDIAFALDNIKLKKEREEAKVRLRESEERYRSVIDNVGIGVSLISHDMEILALNRQMKEWFPSIDETRKPVCYRAFNDPPRDEICDYCPTYKTLADGQRHEAVTSTPTGRGIKHYRIVSTPIKDGNSRVISAIEMVEDITEKKRSGEEKHRLEKELRQAQKMEAIGTLAGGIAHDFNNILASIVGYTELALDDAEKGSALAANLQEVLQAGGRAADLVRHILTFSRQSDEKRRPIQITSLVKEALQLLRSSIPTTIDIRRDVQADLDNVLADPVQIHQIVMNLCTNAAHAMRKEGGILEVNLRQVSIDFDSIAEHPDITPGQYLRLTVSDTGHGMPSETVERIFEPYFTTKEKGEGTGMGLSLVHGIVKSCDGAIKVYSEPGNGTTFNVYLPAIEGSARKQEALRKPVPTGTERILFVDDEPTLADLGRQRLNRLGYEVTTRTSSTEALELFKAKPEAFDLVMTDMTMPHMAGDRLVKEMKKVRPDIPVILCTGYSTYISEEKAKGLGIGAFAMKPLVTSELAEIVRRVLDASTGQ